MNDLDVDVDWNGLHGFSGLDAGAKACNQYQDCIYASGSNFEIDLLCIIWLSHTGLRYIYWELDRAAEKQRVMKSAGKAAPISCSPASLRPSFFQLLARDPGTTIDRVFSHCTGFAIFFCPLFLPSTPGSTNVDTMPGLLRRLIVFTAAEGLILQAPGNGVRSNGHNESPCVRIDYMTGKISVLPTSPVETCERDSGLETYGLVGKA